MRLVNVRFNKIRVDYFSVIDYLVNIEIFFNDGADKQILKKIKIRSVQDMIDEVIADMILMEKNINLEFDGEKIAGEVKVVIDGEEEIRKKLAEFFEEITAKAQRIRSMKTSRGYLGLLSDIKRMEAML